MNPETESAAAFIIMTLSSASLTSGSASAPSHAHVRKFFDVCDTADGILDCHEVKMK
jgi:hypothetical protein